MSAYPFTTSLLAEAKQYYQQGDLVRAEHLCRRMLGSMEGKTDAMNLLGAIAHRSGNVEAAIAWLRQAVQSDPRNAHFQNNLGVYCTHANKPSEAIPSYQQAIRLQPDFADAYNNLTYALYALGRNEEARVAGEQALRLRPNFAEAHNHLGLALMELGQANDAADHFQKAIRLQPRLAAVHRNLGNALRELGRSAEALACYEQAIRLAPDFAEAHSDLGDVLKEQGRFKESVDHLWQALRIKPDYALVYWNLAEFASQGVCQLSQLDIDRIRSLLNNPRMPPVDRSVLHMTLGKVFEKLGPPEVSFSHYQQGNSLRKEWLKQIGQAFDPAAHRDFVDRLITNFNGSFFQQERPSGSGSELPIFLVGMPRSGTTLVQQIISSHSKAVGAGELWDITKIAAELDQKAPGGGAYPAIVSSLKKSDLRHFADRYHTRLAKMGGQAFRVVDKMPQNFLHLGLIALLFPKARIIHCHRDPIDVCVSCYFQNFNRVPFAWSLEDLGMYHAEYERLMAHWRRVLPVTIMDVGYEDLVARQETVTRDLIAFCGLAWEDRCLAFHENRRQVRTASAVQVRQPMYTKSIGRWQKFATQLEPLRQALGRSSSDFSGAVEHQGNAHFSGHQTPG